LVLLDCHHLFANLDQLPWIVFFSLGSPWRDYLLFTPTSIFRFGLSSQQEDTRRRRTITFAMILFIATLLSELLSGSSCSLSVEILLDTGEGGSILYSNCIPFRFNRWTRYAFLGVLSAFFYSSIIRRNELLWRELLLLAVVFMVFRQPCPHASRSLHIGRTYSVSVDRNVVGSVPLRS